MFSLNRVRTTGTVFLVGEKTVKLGPQDTSRGWRKSFVCTAWGSFVVTWQATYVSLVWVKCFMCCLILCLWTKIKDLGTNFRTVTK